MSSHGLVAPARVLLDGGSYYSMAGLSLRSQMGLTEADMDAGGHKPGVAAPRIKLSIINSNKNNYHRDSEHI
jgi:hypothetical protein